LRFPSFAGFFWLLLFKILYNRIILIVYPIGPFNNPEFLRRQGLSIIKSKRETSMFKKILVCLDGSKLAEEILPYAVEQARRFESELVLFRAYSESPTISLAMPGMPGVPIDTKRLEKQLLEDEREVEAYLKSCAEKLQAQNPLKISYTGVLGSAGPSIVDYCAGQGIEMIAIATHGRSGPGKVVLGSVADYVIRHSGLPILLVRPSQEKR
jgi:nucleotide-binding universal stress UspA family protein